MRTNCETCVYNKPIEENGWYENECIHPDNPGIKSDWVFLNGCNDWTWNGSAEPTTIGVTNQRYTRSE